MQTPPPPRDPTAFDPGAAAPPPTVEDLSAVIAHLQAVREQERIKLSRALHDDLGGLLVSAVMDLGWIDQHQAPGDVRERLGRVRSALAAAIDLKRNLTEELRPSLLDNFGLFAAYRWHVKHACQRAGVTCNESYPVDELNLNPTALSGLFRTMQETLALILAEGSVRKIDVTVQVAEGTLLLRTEHAHEGEEITDLFAKLAGQMGAITRRIDALGGRFLMKRHAVGSTLSAYFPVERLLDAG